MGKVFHGLWTAVFIVAAFPFVVTIGAKYEGKWFPVVSKLEILRVIPDGEDHSLVYVRFNKIRDCEYIGVSWFSVEAGYLDRRAIVLKPDTDESDSNRPTGVQVSGPWRIAMPADEVRSQSLVMLTHQCNPLYVTRTQIFP